jgi:hypothetical protein
MNQATIEGPVQALHADDLARLERALVERGAPVSFAPPVTDQELARLESALGRSLPQDLRTLFRWHNGAERVTPYNDFLSATQAAEERLNIRRELGNLWKEFPLLRDLVPVLRRDGDFMMVRCDQPQASPVYGWSYWAMEPMPLYASLFHMVKVFEQAYLSGAFHASHDGWHEDFGLLRRVRDSFQPALVARRGVEAQARCAIASDPEAPSMNRQIALRELGYEQSAVPMMIRLLADRDPEVVRYAAFALGQMHVREALPALLELLDREPRVAADALADVLTPEDSAAVARLLPLLDHAEQSPRIAALNALRALRSPDAVPKVIELLQDRDVMLYYHAVQVLASTRDRRAVEPLRALLGRVDSIGLDPTPRGGSRGSAMTPTQLRMAIEKALEYILAS